MVVYIDALFLINFYVTYFQILAVCVFTHRQVCTARKILGAAFGGVCAFAVFIPQDLVIFTAFIKIAMCFLLTLIVFGFSKPSEYLKYSVFLLLVNFIFAGLMLCVWLFAAPMNMLYSNGTLYFDIDFITVLLCTASAYGVMKIVRFILDKNGSTDGEYSVTVKNNGKSCTISALSDSANGMIDYFSGLPVIICRKDVCTGVSPPLINRITNLECTADELNELKGVRVLPYSTVSSNGMLFTFKADSIEIDDKQNNKKFKVNALIGIAPDSNQEYGAIFNPKILV